nr:uncharacterized protein LOC115266270 [Aedes albopictus]
MNDIKNVLCEFLQSVYGFRPSAFHKNLLAQSLVRSYPALMSSNPDVPQALWFHPNARGKNHHSGRLHYHMEYLARKSGVRIVHRGTRQTEETNGTEETGADSANSGEEADMVAVVQELKFLCPGPNTKLRAEELWHLTFNERKEMRQNRTFHVYLETYPAATTAFNGSLVSIGQG